MQENQGMMELLEKMAKDNEAQNQYLRKQLFFTRVYAVSGCVLTIFLLLVILKVVPPLLGAVDKAVTALDQATDTLVIVDDTLNQASDTLAQVSDTLADVQTLFEEDGLVGQSSTALQQATEKISQMDIESLNAAIKDLGDVVEPLAEFFGKFRR